MNPSPKNSKKPTQSLVGDLASASKSGTKDPSQKKCPIKKHFVKVKLLYKDDNKPVPAAACKILLGQVEVDGGPLANGQLGTAKDLDAGNYEVTFPDIDSAEWDVG